MSLVQPHKMVAIVWQHFGRYMYLQRGCAQAGGGGGGGLSSHVRLLLMIIRVAT